MAAGGVVVRIETLPDWCPVWWFGAGAIAIVDRVYIKRSYLRWMGHNDIVFLKAHESVHLRQQQEETALKFFFKYIFCSGCRLRYEVEAVCAELVERWNTYSPPESFRDTDIRNRAKSLSGSAYFWMTSAEKAEKAIRQKLIDKY